MLKEEILKILAYNSERKIAKFLCKHPQIVLWSFISTGGHSKYVLHEFPLGSKFKADFVIPFSFSGAWEVHFVELKSPDAIIITKNGTPSKLLNSAISQINDWKSFVENNKSIVQQDLSDWCIKHDLLRWHENKFPISNWTSDYLHDPNTFIWFNYHIIIGRRDNVSKEQ